MSGRTSHGTPLLTRFRFATVGAPDVGPAEAFYVDVLGYRVRERGTIAEPLAASWGAPAIAGHHFTVLGTDGATDDYVRIVETGAVPGYRPLTTFGWAAFEIIVDDVHQVHRRLAEADVTILAPPTPLQFMPSIVAMQAIGPAGECLYFTMESGDRDTSILPRPRSLIDRPFILVVAGPDFDALHNWYCDLFYLKRRPLRESRIAILQQAQGLSADRTIRMTTAGLADHGYLLEFDEYPSGPGHIAGPRPRGPGALPPGCAMASFVTRDLDPFAPLAFSPPVVRHGLGYDGNRACTVRGPVGELVEIIEEKP